MKGGYIKCSKSKCFANICGTYCKILSAPIIGKPCPFFKTLAQYENDREEAYTQLWKTGHRELIKKYSSAEDHVASTIIRCR